MAIVEDCSIGRSICPSVGCCGAVPIFWFSANFGGGGGGGKTVIVPTVAGVVAAGGSGGGGGGGGGGIGTGIPVWKTEAIAAYGWKNGMWKIESLNY